MGSLAKGWTKQRRRGEAPSWPPGRTSPGCVFNGPLMPSRTLPKSSAMSLIPSQVFSQVTYLSFSKYACLLLPRASKGPPNLATQWNLCSPRTPPCPSLSCPAEQEPQALPEQGLCCFSAPSPRLWSGSCPLLSVAPMCVFLACSSYQNLNFSLGFSYLKGKNKKEKASVSPSSSLLGSSAHEIF